MKVYYDLHIHSALSPCADESMTPNNIVLMAKIKGLNLISVTDHNSAKNIEAVAKICEREGILFIPGIEVETVEGVHLLCYCETIETMNQIGEMVEKHLGPIKNRSEFFGTQLVMNEEDEILQSIETLLIQSTTLTMGEIVQFVHQVGGIVIAAHINKSEHNILTNLGFIPKGLELDGVELNTFILKQQGKMNQFENYLVLINSDAHQLGDISEPENFIILKRQSLPDFISYIKGETK